MENNEQQAGNKYPIQMLTVYPGIWIEIQSDYGFLYALDNKPDMARNLLVRKFFPDASPEEVREVVRSLSLTGINADEYGKVEEYADRKRSIRLQEEAVNEQKKRNSVQDTNLEAYRRANEQLKNELDTMSPLYLTVGMAGKHAAEVLNLAYDYIRQELRTRLTRNESKYIKKPHDKRDTKYYPLPDIIKCLIEFRKNAPEDSPKLSDREWYGELSKLGKHKSEILK